MTLGSLRGRLRSLSVEQLVQVRTYEKAHADRLPVVTMLDNRIAKLATDASATPSGPAPPRPRRSSSRRRRYRLARSARRPTPEDQPAVAGRPDQPRPAPLARARDGRPAPGRPPSRLLGSRVAAPSTAEQPLPVRTVARHIAEWVSRLGKVWVEGQVTEVSKRPGTVFLTLRDPVADVACR